MDELKKNPQRRNLMSVMEQFEKRNVRYLMHVIYNNEDPEVWCSKRIVGISQIIVSRQWMCAI